MEPPTHDAGLEAELIETRRRLAEAESTLEAIRFGNVDALVVTDNRGQEEVHGILNMGSLANSMFNLVTQPIFILDAQGRIQRLNQAGLDLAGPEPIGRAFLDALPLKVESQEAETGRNALAQWIPKRMHIEALDVNYEHPAFGTRFYLLDANPVEIGWEGETGGIVTLMDITARKLAEIQLVVRSSQLRRQLSLLQSITENIPEGLLLADDENQVIFSNRAALAILEREEHEVIGMELDSLFRPKPDTRDPAHPDAPILLDEAEETQRRGLLERRVGGWRPVQFALHPLKGKSEEAGRILVMSDISEQVASEQALRQSIEKQQHSQRIEAIGRLAGGIAHDFNNLLLAILGFTDLSLVQVREGTQVHENLKEVKRAGERAAALTSQLLAYSRKQILDPKVHDLNEALRDILKMLERLMGENIRLEVGIAARRLPTRFDQSKLQQVLVNMALNARDAMPEGGTLSLRTGLAHFADRELSGMVRETARENEDGIPPGDFTFVEIEDTGHGMSEGVLEHLFEPFFTTKEFGKGSGLGLSTAYGIVKQMGGHVQVYSAPGKGSRFRVLLPLAPDAGEVPEAPRKELQPAHAGKGESILLVEDEPVVRKLLAKVLADHGYRVIEAADGEAALERLPGPGETPLSLVITDIVMDRMGGIELAGRLAVLRPGLAVLFISGYAEDQHKLSMDGAERPFFAAKPFRPADFLILVRKILERRTEVPGPAAIS
jgi:two-component system, cell cycle sensor histidine kinase and response regulator CckA